MKKAMLSCIFACLLTPINLCADANSPHARETPADVVRNDCASQMAQLDPVIFWTDGTGLVGKTHFDGRPSEILLRDGGDLNGLTAAWGKVIWGRNPRERFSGKPGSVNTMGFDGSRPTELILYRRSDGQNGRPHFFFPDEPHGDIYWSENSWIYVAKSDGSGMRSLRSDLIEAGGIVKHENFIYYLSEDDPDHVGQTIGRHIGHLYRVDLSDPDSIDPHPKNPPEELMGGISQGRGMTIDKETGTLYFVSAVTKECKSTAPKPSPKYCSCLQKGIMSYNISTRKSEIIQEVASAIGLSFKPGKNGEAPHLMWADQHNRAIKAMNLKTGQINIVSEVPGSGLFDVVYAEEPK